jgi:hypothetical protein
VVVIGAMVMVMDRQTKITKQYTPIVHAFAISLGQKWQRTQVTKKKSCSQ